MEQYKQDKQLVSALCLLMGHDLEKIKSRSDSKRLSIPRKIIFTLLRDEWGWGFEKIGKHVNRCHKSIFTAIHTLDDITKYDRELRENVSGWLDYGRSVKNLLDKKPQTQTS